ncbi:ornithine carbamoyltransferase [Mycetohabitans endofungorum]|uniref:ornithine carbamoyltransferase n=1 Tax=Mycetohabitans endofungorum TaxID=417203 RepID=UPI002B0543BD|nr:ornithine carbamoyltransferase [Mycetohabitans endofungorum]
MNVKASTLAKVVVLVSLVPALSACGSLSRSEKHAAIGAAAGGALGYVLTGGPLGTVAGAAAGGLVGAGH